MLIPFGNLLDFDLAENNATKFTPVQGERQGDNVSGSSSSSGSSSGSGSSSSGKY